MQLNAHGRRTRCLPVIAGVLALAACSTTTATAPASSMRSTVSRTSPGAPSSPVTSSGAVSSSTSTPATAPSRPDPATARRADSTIARLTDDLGQRGVSIAALDTGDGVTFDYGARHGMLCASIAKLYILETVLMQHQQSGTPLGDENQALAARMIEHSDNDAANDLYADIGQGAGLRRAAPALGVENTTPGSGIYWGYTRTGAASYLALLRDLTGPGPLDHASRRYALHLLAHVEADQQWGTGSVADRGTTPYVKNGWLAVSTDGGRWAVNSVGIITDHGHRLLMVIMTQHGAGFDSGVDLVDHLARITAAAVTSR